MGASSVVGPLKAAIAVGVAVAGLNVVGVARASTAQCRPEWGVEPANPALGVNELQGVATISACDAWAVGFDSNNSALPQTGR
jgi:hypothetical protein